MQEAIPVDENYVSVLDSAKKCLKQILLKNERFSHTSVENMLRYFNVYMDIYSPFEDCQTTNGIGFSWQQIKVMHNCYKGIANVALKLHNSGVSEASCERTLSTQKLIYNARRRHSNKLTLDTRLILMRTELK